MRRLLRVVTVIAMGVLAPTVVFAQAQITGVVRDASGAVLPGVTVEAASDVLIEKVRTATTDGSGQYRVIDLRPGSYTVTFTLPGFSTVKREGVELTGSFVATINAELKVGGLQETITVTGETPIVDTQSIRRQTTLTNEVLHVDPDRPFVGGHRGPDSRHRHPGRSQRGRPGDAADDGLRRCRRAR